MISAIGSVLDLTEVQSVREAVAAGEFEDGRATAGYRAKSVKQNEQLSRGKKDIQDLIVRSLRGNKEFKRTALPRKIRPPIISRYQPGMEYGTHVDDALMGPDGGCRSDLSVTVFLSDLSDYEGGELEIETPFGTQEIKLPAGAAVVYPSSCLHRVLPVREGTRLAAVTWVQSHVRDPQKREILHDLDSICAHLHKSSKDSEQTDLAFKSYSNLMRMWSEP